MMIAHSKCSCIFVYCICLLLIFRVVNGEEQQQQLSLFHSLVDFVIQKKMDAEMHSTRSINTQSSRGVLQQYLNLDESHRQLIDALLDQTIAKLKQAKKSKRSLIEPRLMSEEFLKNLLFSPPLPANKTIPEQKTKRGMKRDDPTGADLHTYPTDFAVTDLVFPTDGKNFMSIPITPYSIGGLSGGASSCTTNSWPTLQDSGRVLGLWKELQEIFLNIMQGCDFLPESWGVRSICLGVVEFINAFVTAVAEYRYRHMLLCRNILDYASTQNLLDNTIQLHKQTLLMRRMQLENALLSPNKIASLIIPQAKGGQFEAGCYVAYDTYNMGIYYDLFADGQKAAAGRFLQQVASTSPYLTNYDTLQLAYNTMSQLLKVGEDSNFPDTVVEADLVSNRGTFKDKCFFDADAVPTYN